jgi:hypothetical protein
MFTYFENNLFGKKFGADHEQMKILPAIIDDSSATAGYFF